MQKQLGPLAPLPPPTETSSQSNMLDMRRSARSAGSRDEARRRLGDISATALALLRESDARASQAGLAVHREVAGSSPGAPRVGIIMGSDSDLPTMAGAAEVLREFGVACEVTVVSAHR